MIDDFINAVNSFFCIFLNDVNISRFIFIFATMSLLQYFKYFFRNCLIHNNCKAKMKFLILHYFNYFFFFVYEASIWHKPSRDKEPQGPARQLMAA
jgi:hypothetical protein